METTQERLLRYLNDAWAVEKALVGTLQDMADEINDPQVEALFLEHRTQTREQEERLAARIRTLGGEPSGGKGLLNQLMAKIGDMLHAAHDEYDKTVLNLIKAYATENFESAVYESMLAYASAISDVETAQLARQHLEQEQAAAKKVWPLIAPAAGRVMQAAPA